MKQKRWSIVLIGMETTYTWTAIEDHTTKIPRSIEEINFDEVNIYTNNNDNLHTSSTFPIIRI